MRNQLKIWQALLSVFLIASPCLAGMDFSGLGDKAIVVPDFKSRYEASLWAMNHKGERGAVVAVTEKLKDLTKIYDGLPSKTKEKLEALRIITWNANAIEVMQRFGATIRIGVERIK